MIGERTQELELLGKSTHGPGQAARPGPEGQISLLCGRAAVRPVCGVEERFVRDSSADIPNIAAFSIVNAVSGSTAKVRAHTLQQRDPAIVFAQEQSPKLMAYRKREQRADRIDKQRVWPV